MIGPEPLWYKDAIICERLDVQFVDDGILIPERFGTNHSIVLKSATGNRRSNDSTGDSPPETLSPVKTLNQDPLGRGRVVSPHPPPRLNGSRCATVMQPLSPPRANATT